MHKRFQHRQQKQSGIAAGCKPDFVVGLMRPPGAITSAAQAAQVLSIKIGEVLLVLGAAHLAGVAVVRRFGRRGRQDVN